MLRHGFFIGWSILKMNNQVLWMCHVYNAVEINPEMKDV
jgi:hypothetical protein